MQDVKKKLVYSAVGKTVKKLRGKKSQYLFGAEYDIPQSVLSDLENCKKDPQLTTLLKLAESFGLSFSEFAAEIEKELPDGFSLIDD
ncbi:MAG: helix-turn-helix domain-containing protein [Candidatus Gastranaerophilaceae bacterium]